MSTRTVRLATILLIAASALTGCASEREARVDVAGGGGAALPGDMFWLPDTSVRIATLERTAHAALVADEAELLILESRVVRDNTPLASAAYAVALPYNATTTDGPIELSLVNGAPRGWLLLRDSQASHAIPLVGEVRLVRRTGDVVVASVMVRPSRRAAEDAAAVIGWLDRGDVSGLSVSITGDWRLADRPAAVPTPELATRSGAAHREASEAHGRKTDAVWPWQDLFGDDDDDEDKDRTAGAEDR